MHPLLLSKENRKRAREDDPNLLIQSFIDFRSRIPSNWQQSYRFQEVRQGVYLCEGRDSNYITTEHSCSCDSWKEQIELQEWFASEDIEYKPMCKHQAMLLLHLSNPQSPKPSHSVLWSYEDGLVRTWITRDNITIQEFKTFPLKDFMANKTTAMSRGWKWIKKSSIPLLSTTSSRRRRA